MDELKKLNLNVNDVSAAAGKHIESLKDAAVRAPQMVQGASSEISKNKPVWPLVAVALVLGVASGFGLYKALPGNPQTSGVDNSGQVTSGIKVGDVVGSADEKIFKDKAEGVIEKGTTSGEGSHSLLRSGGASKTANLTSSVIDLDQFVGMRVEVWGETFAAQKSGWLMDVGRIKVLELNAPKPE